MAQKPLDKKKAAIIEYSAGGVVFRAARKEFELAFVLDSTKKWTFPKGHIRRGEKIEEAAKRESEEEMGLHGLQTIRRLGQIDIWFVDKYVHKGALIHKYIYYVLMRAPSYARLRIPPRPKRGEPLFGVRWMPLQEALQFSNYKDVQPILKRAIEAIEKIR